MRTRVGAIVILTSLLLSACDTPTAPSYPRGKEFALAPGGTASIEETTARIRFDAVIEDSRCPINALCIQAGDAAVRIQVWSNTASGSYDLGLVGLVHDSTVVHEDLAITLVALAPHPFAGQTIDPKDYRATFLAK